MGHGLIDRRGFCRAKICGLDPRLGLGTPLLLVAGTFLTAFAFAFTLGFRIQRGLNFGNGFSRNFGGGFRLRFRMRMGKFFRWHGFAGFFRVRLAKIAGSIPFGICHGFMHGRFIGGFGNDRGFFTCRQRFIGCGARSTTTATTTTAPATAHGRTARGGWQIQIGMFVRHNLFMRMTAPLVNAMANYVYFFTNNATTAV